MPQRITHFASQPDALEQLSILFRQSADTLEESDNSAEATSVRHTAVLLIELRNIAKSRFSVMGKAQAVGAIKKEELPLERRLARVAACIHTSRVRERIEYMLEQTIDILEHDKNLTLSEVNALLHNLTDAMRELAGAEAPAEYGYGYKHAGRRRAH